jgi:cyclase
MLRKRIIFALIYSNGSFMQSRNFRLQKVGNLHWLEKNYKFQNIAFALDELIVLNATKGEKNMTEFASTISKLVNNVFIPIAAGGGIQTMEDAELLFKNPSIVKELIKNYGSQSVIASVDCKLNGSVYEIFIKDGTQKIDFELLEYINYLEKLEVGEIYLNSIDKDGTGFGYDQTLIELVNKATCLPLIIAGGAGNENHLAQGLKIENVGAVATANLFNFIGDGLPNARKQIINSNENIANWSINNYIIN